MIPREKGLHCKRAARRAAMLADCTAHSAALPRWHCYTIWFASTTRYRSAHLVEVQPNSRLPMALINAASAAMPLFRTQSAAVLPSLAPHDRKARLRAVTTRRDLWRSHVHRTYIAQRVQLFKLQTRNVNFLLGDVKAMSLS